MYTHRVESIVMRLDDAVRGDINEVIHWVGFYVTSVKTLCMKFVEGVGNNLQFDGYFEEGFMIDAVKKTYNNGYYLVQNYAGDGIDIVHITNYNNRVVVHLAGNEWEGGLEDFHWITDEPLNLEQIALLHKTGYDCTCND